MFVFTFVNMDVDTSRIDKDRFENVRAEIETSIVILNRFPASFFTNLSDVSDILLTYLFHMHGDINIRPNTETSLVVLLSELNWIVCV